MCGDIIWNRGPSAALWRVFAVPMVSPPVVFRRNWTFEKGVTHMTRREAWELAFVLLFEMTFTDEPVRSILENAAEARDVEGDAFALSLAEGAAAHLTEEDELISAFSRKWNKDRLSRVALSIMRLAIYEMEFEEDIPVSVSINEAVELAKKYGGEDDASFINGVLGGVARRGNPAGEEPNP